MNKTISILMLAALAGTAIAANPGDIVFTDQNDTSIKLLASPGSGNTLSTLVSLPGLPFGADGSLWRPAGITADASGRYYFANQDFNTTTQSHVNNGIWAVDDIFGTPTVSSFISSPQDSYPFDVDFDAANNGLVWNQNPWRFDGESVPDGLNGSYINSPANLQFHAENTAGPRPFYEGGVFMVKDPNSSDYFCTALNGGVGAGVGDSSTSTLWRLSPNFANPGASTLTLVKDFTTDPALANPMRWLRGITAVPGTNDLYVTNTLTDHQGNLGATTGVYKITLNPDGSYASMTLINSGILLPEAIEFNPYTGKLVIASFNDANNNGLADDGIIYQMNLDGSGLEILAQGVHARDFHIVPTPGALALLGLSGLIAIRRRR